jgi:hypothetical protein
LIEWYESFCKKNIRLGKLLFFDSKNTKHISLNSFFLGLICLIIIFHFRNKIPLTKMYFRWRKKKLKSKNLTFFFMFLIDFYFGKRENFEFGEFPIIIN